MAIMATIEQRLSKMDDHFYAISMADLTVAFSSQGEFCRSLTVRVPDLGHELRNALVELVEGASDRIGLIFDGPTVRHGVLQLPPDLHSHLLQVASESRIVTRPLNEEAGESAECGGHQDMQQGQPSRQSQFVHVVIPLRVR